MNPASGTYQLGLIGWPLGHSLSPLMHNAALQAAGLAGEYQLYPIPPFPEGQSLLRELLGKVKSGEIQGLNITIPHKQNVLPFLDVLSPAARAIGAVNTISLNNGRLTGDNTDWSGFLCDLATCLPADHLNKPMNALVIGAGGSARGIVYALLTTGWQVTISSRRFEQAQQLATDFSTHAQTVFAFAAPQFAELTKTTLIVNTTPVGMFPATSSSPWPDNLPFPKQVFLYDLIYNPSETALMKTARSAGLSAVNGLGMLAEQAAMSFEIWTGQPNLREVFRRTVFERKPE
jgi:shikimate dehydrogenase